MLQVARLHGAVTHNGGSVDGSPPRLAHPVGAGIVEVVEVADEAGKGSVAVRGQLTGQIVEGFAGCLLE